MMQRLLMTRRSMLYSLVGVMMTAMLTLWGCGGSSSNSTGSYPKPEAVATTTKTATALIQPAELLAWINEGKVNQAGGTDRVVIVETSSLANYNGEHIPGAQNVSLSADLTEARYEGPMQTGELVPSGTKMDALIQKLGIDANTTIVFTSSDAEVGAPWNLTRGYVTFRYWGFPKNRLKVLDGGNKSWKAAGYPMTNEVPVITKSSYCVTAGNVSRIRTDLRASLTEMIAAAQAGTVKAGTGTGDIIDGRATDPTVPGPTTDLMDGTKYVVFDGLIKGGRAYSYANLIDATTKKFKPIATIKSGLNIPASAKSVYAMCRAGNVASALFFAIDGYAYYNETELGTMKAYWYDGSFGQWGLLSSNSANGGKLPANSVWDTSALTDSLTYNLGKTVGTKTLAIGDIINYSTRLVNPPPSLSLGNQLEEADEAYRSPVTSTSGGGSTAGGVGGC